MVSGLSPPPPRLSPSGLEMYNNTKTYLIFHGAGDENSKRLSNLSWIPTAHKSAGDESFLSDREEAKSKLCWLERPASPHPTPTPSHPHPAPAGIFMRREEETESQQRKSLDSSKSLHLIFR